MADFGPLPEGGVAETGRKFVFFPQIMHLKIDFYKKKKEEVNV